MCGIFGVINLSADRDFDVLRFRAGLSRLRHRGPDAENFKQFGNQVLLGHTRLSIIDVSEENHQPLSILGRYWIVYNGEIFNYIELRRELESLGAYFRTSGDTEVLIQAFAHWGESCVERFNGMWAFAIYDTSSRVLFCSRDRYGEKPFNYVIDRGQLIFASEIKSILTYRPDLAEPEYNAIANFCRTSVGAQQTQTWFKNIIRLQPGHNMVVHDGRVVIQRYWQYPTGVDRNISFEQARSTYAALFEDAVRLRMRSDVPLGLTLSAGLDSSSIAYTMHSLDPCPHHAFTSCFTPEDCLVTDQSIYVQSKTIDEYESALCVAKQLHFCSHAIVTDYSNLVASLRHVLIHLESGNSSPAVIPLMQLMAYAKRHVKVLLEGQGADELLGGYVGNLLWPTFYDLISEGRPREAMRFVREFSDDYRVPLSIFWTRL